MWNNYQTDALAYAGAVSCLERLAVYDTRAYYLLTRAVSDLSRRMAFRSGSLETTREPVE